MYGKTREIVHDKWIKLHQQAKAGPVATAVPTLGDFMARWLAKVVEPNLAPLTNATYETFTRPYIVPGLGRHRLDRLQARVREVQTWLNSLGTTCQCCAQGKDAVRPAAKQRCCGIGQCCHTVLSARTVSDIRATLRSALARAIEEDLITKNVSAIVKLPGTRSRKNSRKGSRTRRSWTGDEARRFLESAKADDDLFYAAYVLVLVLGLRKVRPWDSPGTMWTWARRS